MITVNWSRVVLGGLLWAAVYGVLGAVAMFLFLGREFFVALDEIGRPLQVTSESLALLAAFGVVFTVGWGIVTMWLYAAIRPRYGQGARTATVAAIAVWLLAVVAPVSHLVVFGVVSGRFAAIDIPAEFVAILAATLAGARIYRE